MPIETRFRCSRVKSDYMKVESHYKGTDVILTLNTAGLEQEIYLDITTAIKLSKTIRTEINKVKEGSNV